MVMFKYSIYEMHFGIMKAGLISGIAVGILYTFLEIEYYFSIRLGLWSGCLPIKDDLIRSLRTVLFRKLHLLSK